jgi:hypothetical protein
MLHWIVAKAVLGLKAVLLASVSLATSADWSPSSQTLVRVFQASADGSPISIVAIRRESGTHECCPMRMVRIIRLEDVSQALEVPDLADDLSDDVRGVAEPRLRERVRRVPPRVNAP